MAAETSIVEGGGSQTGDFYAYRWGDYSSMSIDPIFDCSFWYTNQYLQTTGFENWSTSLASFRLSSCVGCVGDCNRNHVVTVDELLTMVNIDLGSAPIINCLRGDANGDGLITIDEINAAVYNANHGCPTGSTAPVGGAAPLEGPIAGAPIAQKIGSASSGRGTTVTIPVTIRNGAGVVAATQLDVLYPTAVLGNPQCVKARRLTSHALWTSLPDSPATPPGMARLRAIVADLDAAGAFSDGPLFMCTFTINPTAAPGTYPVTGEDQAVSDEVGDALISTVTDGSVTVY